MRESESSPRGAGGRVLIADETRGVARLAARVLEQAGYQCERCESAADLLRVVERRGADVVLADLALPVPELVRQLESRFPEVALIVLTFTPGVGSAVAAMRQGAFDYLVKPLDEDELCVIVGRAIEMGRLRRETIELRRRVQMADVASSFVAESAAAKQLLALVRRIAPTDSTVLIEGEIGTGKELVAQMLHYWSGRLEGPFVPVNCKGSAALAPARELISNGAAGAGGEHHLIPVRRAAGGTLFLNEIAEAGPAFQAELVRILDEAVSPPARHGEGIGIGQVRIVLACSGPLRGEVEAGRFREDLFFTLNAVPIRMPPLRERREDIPVLAHRFLAACGARTGRRFSLTSDAERELLSYRWPGNVLELRNVIERAAMLTNADFITSKVLDLPTHAEPEGHDRMRIEPAHHDGVGAHLESAPASNAAPSAVPSNVADAASVPAAENSFESVTLQECLDKAARARIKAALESAGGNRGDAAKALEVDGTTLGRLIKRLGL